MNDWLDTYFSPDSLVKKGLEIIFGSSSIILAVYLIVTGILGFRSAGRSLLKGVKTARASIEGVEFDRSSAGATVAMHVCIIALQAMWVFTTYAIGVVISVAANMGDKLTSLNADFWDGVGAVMRTNTTISISFLAAAIAALLICYSRSSNENSGAFLTILFGGYPFVMAAVLSIGAVFMIGLWLLGLGLGGSTADVIKGSDIFIPLGGALVGFLYFKATSIAFDGPHMLYKLRQRHLASH